MVYIPRSYLAQAMPDGKAQSLDETAATPTDSPKTSKQKRPGMKKSSSLRKGSELDDSSSSEEAESDGAKEVRVSICILFLYKYFIRIIKIGFIGYHEWCC